MAGRPRKTAATPEAAILVEVAGEDGPQLEVAAMPEDEAPKRKAGRPRSNTPPAGNRAKSLESIERLLLAVHVGIANISHMPELEIGESEAKQLATSLDAVAAQYKIKLDGKHGAVAGLISTLVMVYGPRVAIIVMRQKAEAKNASQTSTP